MSQDGIARYIQEVRAYLVLQQGQTATVIGDLHQLENVGETPENFEHRILSAATAATATPNLLRNRRAETKSSASMARIRSLADPTLSATDANHLKPV
jgi:hypothetical protein